MNGSAQMEVDGGGGHDSEPETETRFAPLIIDGKIKHSVSHFPKLAQKYGEEPKSSTKKIKRTEENVSYSNWQVIDQVKYRVSCGVTVDEESAKHMSFFFSALPTDCKMTNWYIFVDAELRLPHPRKERKAIEFSYPTIFTANIKNCDVYGWPNFATYEEVKPFIDAEEKDKISVEVVIRNQIMFTVSDTLVRNKQPIPTRKYMDHFIRPLYNCAQLSDVHFQIEEDQQVPAHKLVLASKSDILRKLLYEDHEFDRVIDLKKEGFGDIAKSGLLSVLKFFYQNELVITDQILADVYFVGQKFKIDVVLETCKLFVTRDNVIHVLHKSVDYGTVRLTAKCWEKIREDVPAFLKSDNFRTCEPDALKVLLVSDELSAPEYMIFKSCKAWAVNRAHEKGITDPTPADLRRELGDKFNLIRFPLMKHEKLKQILSDFPDLFTEKERNRLTNFMSNLNPEVPLLFSKEKRKPID